MNSSNDIPVYNEQSIFEVANVRLFICLAMLFQKKVFQTIPNYDILGSCRSSQQCNIKVKCTIIYTMYNCVPFQMIHSKLENHMTVFERTTLDTIMFGVIISHYKWFSSQFVARATVHSGGYHTLCIWTVVCNHAWTTVLSAILNRQLVYLNSKTTHIVSSKQRTNQVLYYSILFTLQYEVCSTYFITVQLL